MSYNAALLKYFIFRDLVDEHVSECPGECIYGFISVLCEEILWDISCPVPSMRCCVDRRKNTPEYTDDGNTLTSENKIVGGTEVDISDRPYQVAFMYDGTFRHVAHVQLAQIVNKQLSFFDNLPKTPQNFQK